MVTPESSRRLLRRATTSTGSRCEAIGTARDCRVRQDVTTSCGKLYANSGFLTTSSSDSDVRLLQLRMPFR